MIKGNFIELKTEDLQRITADQAFHYQIVPKSIDVNDNWHFYIDELNYSNEVRDELELILGESVVLEKCDSIVLQQSLIKYYRRKKETSSKILSVREDEDDFLTNLIAEAHHLGSSDIHIEPYDSLSRVRIRIDGKLIERFTIPKEDYPAIVNRIKIKAFLDIAERRLPQDGRIEFIRERLKFDIRVSIIPTLHGEKVVLRLLSRNASQLSLEAIGFSEADLKLYLERIRKPHGIILISGPTGSGKTTTLYATLKRLNVESQNIVTIEDPIEYTLHGINQVQLKEAIGLDFNVAMRSFLRQDPDVIMLGEIRDRDTAEMAIRAALTGHLVFSTIHTNSAWDTVNRLIDMGIPPFLIANTLNLSVAQRLVRVLCEKCKRLDDLDPKSLPEAFRNYNLSKAFVPIGCSECYYTGYDGRQAVYELLPINIELADGIRKGELELVRDQSKHSRLSLADQAFILLKNGETSLEEVYSLLM